MKDEKKRREVYIKLVYAGIAVTLLSAFGAAFLPSLKSVLLTVAAVSSAGAAVVSGIIFKTMKSRIDSAEKIIADTESYAQIRYDKKNETAYIYGKLAEITGLEIAGPALDETDYKKLIVDMISYPSDAGADIYMTARPEGWIKIKTFENDNFEYTMITDVSEIVTCKNIIKSMKYYDGDTGLLCRDAFISKVRSVSDPGAGTVGLISLIIGGVDKLTSFKGTAAADKAVLKAAAFIKRFENPHNIFAGRTATNEFCVLVTDTYEEGCRKYAEKLYDGLNESFANSEGSEYIRVYCGYALFGDEENDPGNMMSAVDYAAFEAKSTSADAPVAFDRANYVLKAYDFKKIQVFKRVVGENIVNYHFQPVVDAHTGAVFGYEALMRPREIDGIKLSPMEVVKIAEEQGMSSAVEYMTLYNTISFLWEKVDAFRDKKLFVNTIPNCFLSNENYTELYDMYGGVFSKLIIEITEGVQITDKSLDLLRARYSGRGALIAMDDYGTGYANESTLLTVKPDFIKIDRSLIMDIDSDVRKQHLVSNMIDFARSHGIKTLAEGVETRGELETIITFGIDLIQGFYTGKPNPALVEEIPEETRDEILGINLKNVGYTKKSCIIDTDNPMDIAELAVRGYTDLILESENVFLTGTTSRTVNLRISCPDEYKGTINIKGLNVFGLEAPVLTLGNNCDVKLNVVGRNYFSYEGIRVPATSRIKICGSGQLNIDMNNNSGVIIGGNYLQDFGAVCINMEGSLNITSQSDNMVAIGGGAGSANSSIEVLSGLITAELKGVNIIGIGAASGNTDIKLCDCSIDIDAAGQNVVAIGSKNGKVNIESSATIEASCSGDNCCCIGTLENGSGKITVEKGRCDLAIHSKNGVNIGSMNGNTSVEIRTGIYNICCEANTAVGIGDGFGSGNVTVMGGIFKMHIAASLEVSIGSAKGRTVIEGGNIVTDSREPITAESPFGDPLEEVRENCAEGETFSRKISKGAKEYTYTASPAEGESFVSVYLPASKEKK